MAIPPIDPNAIQYNKDLKQYEADAWMMNPANPNGWPAMWKDLIDQLKNLHGSPQAVAKAMHIIQFKLLGPTLIDGYDQCYGKVKGDLMSLCSDVGVMENQVSSAFTNAAVGLSPTQVKEFSNAMKDLYAIFKSQKSAGKKSQWLSGNGAQNGWSYVHQLFFALGDTQCRTIGAKTADKMHSWWQTPVKPSVPNPNLKTFQDNLQSLSGINNSVNQAASTEESLNNSNMNNVEAVLKAILTSFTTLETKINQSLASG